LPRALEKAPEEDVKHFPGVIRTLVGLSGAWKFGWRAKFWLIAAPGNRLLHKRRRHRKRAARSIVPLTVFVITRAAMKRSNLTGFVFLHIRKPRRATMRMRKSVCYPFEWCIEAMVKCTLISPVDITTDPLTKKTGSSSSLASTSQDDDKIRKKSC